VITHPPPPTLPPVEGVCLRRADIVLETAGAMRVSSGSTRACLDLWLLCPLGISLKIAILPPPISISLAYFRRDPKLHVKRALLRALAHRKAQVEWLLDALAPAPTVTPNRRVSQSHSLLLPNAHALSR
jgi:hypothetical protein